MVQMKRTVDQLTCSLSSCQEDLQVGFSGRKAVSCEGFLYECIGIGGHID